MTFALLLSLVSTTASATSAPRAPEETLTVAHALYLHADFSGALKVLGQPTAPAPSPALSAKIELERGLCFAALQDGPHMDAAFSAALEWNPSASLNRAQVLPSVVDRLDALRRELLGWLEVSVSPSSAKVLLDGEEVVAPLRAVVPIGTHVLVASAADAEPVEEHVQVTAHRTTHVTLAVIRRSPLRSEDSGPEVAKKSSPTGLQYGVDLRGYLADFKALGVELDLMLAGRLWIIEGGVLAGSFPAVDLRAGARSPELWGRVRGSVTVDGVAFLGASARPIGPGLSANVSVRLAPFLDVLVEASGYRLLGAAGFAPRNDGVLSLGVRLWRR